MAHLDETTLELFVQNAAESIPRRSEIEGHLGECEGCRELYEEIRSFYAEVKQDLDSGEVLPVRSPEASPVKRTRAPEKRYKDHGALRQVDVALPIRVARWVVRHPIASVSGFAGTFGLIVAVLVLVPKMNLLTPDNMNPIKPELANGVVRLLNVAGTVVDSIEIGSENVENEKKYPSIQFQDVDGDGINEVFWYERYPNSSQGNIGMHARSAKNKVTLWLYRWNQKVLFPEKPEIAHIDFHAAGTFIGDHDSDGRSELYMMMIQSQFPRLFIKLDALTGAELGYYLHVGSLGIPKFIDLDGDGVNEILMGGTNQAYKEACLVVLDSRFISGHSPTTGDYAIEGLPEGAERAYIRIPRTIVGEALKQMDDDANGGGLEIQPSNRTIKQDIGEVSFRDGENHTTAHYSVILGFDLTAKSAAGMDDFDLLSDNLFRGGKIGRKVDFEYFREFLRGVKYWDGHEWQQKSVKNRHYSEAVAAKKPLP